MSKACFKPTDEKRQLVAILAVMRLPDEDIAAYVGLRSVKSLNKYFRKELAAGLAEGVETVMGTLQTMAESGDAAANTAWLDMIGSARVSEQAAIAGKLTMVRVPYQPTSRGRRKSQGQSADPEGRGVETAELEGDDRDAA